MSTDAAHGDDGLVAALEHQGDKGAVQQVQPDGVGRKGADPRVRVHLRHLAGLEDGGVGDDDVDLTELLPDLGRRSVDAVLVGNVELDGQNLGRWLPSFRRGVQYGLCRFRGVAPGAEGYHRCPGLGEGDAHCTPEASRRAAYEDGLSLEVGLGRVYCGICITVDIFGHIVIGCDRVSDGS